MKVERIIPQMMSGGYILVMIIDDIRLSFNDFILCKFLSTCLQVPVNSKLVLANSCTAFLYFCITELSINCVVYVFNHVITFVTFNDRVLWQAVLMPS